MGSKTEVCQDKSGEWRWRLIASNGRIVGDSAEGYTTEQGATLASKNVLYAPIKGEVSDGFHTFNELYDHRTRLFIITMKQNYGKSWRSRFHADGTMFDGFFIAGISTPSGDITYHLEEKYWDDLNGVITLDVANPCDGHTPDDVLTRLKDWAKVL